MNYLIEQRLEKRAKTEKRVGHVIEGRVARCVRVVVNGRIVFDRVVGGFSGQTIYSYFDGGKADVTFYFRPRRERFHQI
jgi:hypothetical protein